MTVEVAVRPLPYFAFEADLLPGVRGVGETPERALAALRSELRRRFPYSKFDIEETVFS